MEESTIYHYRRTEDPISHIRRKFSVPLHPVFQYVLNKLIISFHVSAAPARVALYRFSAAFQVELELKSHTSILSRLERAFDVAFLRPRMGPRGSLSG